MYVRSGPVTQGDSASVSSHDPDPAHWQAPRSMAPLRGSRLAGNNMFHFNVALIIIVQVFLKRKILSLENIVSAYTRTHTGTHTQAF